MKQSMKRCEKRREKIDSFVNHQLVMGKWVYIRFHILNLYADQMRQATSKPTFRLQVSKKIPAGKLVPVGSHR